MNWIYFYMQFAILQSEGWGRAVSIKLIMDRTGYSRSQVNRYIKELVLKGFIHKPKRGKYYLTDCRGAQAIGYCSVSPLKMSIYYTEMMKNRS